MKRPERQIAVQAAWLAGILSMLVFFTIPVITFYLSYNASLASLQTATAIKAEMLQTVIAGHPETWEYQFERLEEMLSHHSQLPERGSTAIYNLEGNVVVAGEAELPWPKITVSTGLYESGHLVGNLEASRTLQYLAIKTAGVAAAALLLSISIFILLRRFPIRIMNQTFSALREEKERAEVTLRSIADAVISTDSEQRIENMNPVAEQLTGWRLEEVRGQPSSTVLRLIDEETAKPIDDPLSAAIAGGHSIDIQDHAVLLSHTGNPVAVQNNTAPIMMPNGAITGGVIVLRDVTKERDMTRRISWQASHDALTGLINRAEFGRQLKDAVENFRVSGRPYAVLFLDLDQFKIVNDTCGHTAGDELLRQIADALSDQLRRTDLLARLGGDEFAVLLLGCTPEQGHEIATKLLTTVRDLRFAWEGKTFSVGVSIGLVNITAGDLNSEQVMAAADKACYAAKEAGRGRVQVYNAGDSAFLDRQAEMDWTTRIVRALQENRFALYHQEYLPLSQQAGAPRHLEILLRMVDEDGSVILPGAFIPAAERYDLMPDIDRWVIETAFSHHQELQDRFGTDAVCSINLSGTSLNGGHVLSFIRKQAEEYNILPSTVCFEITETSAINQLREASNFIAELKREGYLIALDDFGTGMSSFAYLRSLQPDYLKIDGSFVHDIITDQIDQELVMAINHVGHVMGLKTVAEFAYSEPMLEKLREIGVDFAQGMAIGEPMPLVDAAPPEHRSIA
jgi:diguanylate cyclase (GGDEF)-like protein/PAS domain S-box-containing protein